MPIIILPEADHDTITELLQNEVDFCERRTDLEDSTKIWERLLELFEEAPSEHVIRIVVEGGAVQAVENLPMGFLYEVQDFDNCSDCGNIEPLCDWCKGNGL